MTPTVPHALAAAGDLVACDIHRATLPALACARRHVAREYRGHRSGRDLDSLARYPSCAACPLGAVARERLGVSGSPGATEVVRVTVPRDEYLRPLGDVRAATMRPVRVERDDLPRTPVVRHEADALGAAVTGDAVALWQTRRVRCAVLTPDAVGDALAAAGWTAVDAWAWRDEDGGVLGWPLAMAAVRRRARRGA